MTGLGTRGKVLGGSRKADISGINGQGSGWWLFLRRWLHSELSPKCSLRAVLSSDGTDCLQVDGEMRSWSPTPGLRYFTSSTVWSLFSSRQDTRALQIPAKMDKAWGLKAPEGGRDFKRSQQSFIGWCLGAHGCAEIHRLHRRGIQGIVLEGSGHSVLPDSQGVCGLLRRCGNGKVTE